jgi:hypothetical protein
MYCQFLVLPPCNFGQILVEMAHKTSQILRLPAADMRPLECDIGESRDKHIEDIQLDRNVTKDSSADTDIVSAQEMILKVRKINRMIEDILQMPSSKCNTLCRKKILNVIQRCKNAMQTPLTSYKFSEDQRILEFPSISKYMKRVLGI